MRALSWRSSAQCCGTCLSTSTNPMTASRSGSGRETRQGAFDVGDDPEGDCQRFAPVGTGHGHRRLAADRREKALELEAERFALRGLERYALDECLQRLCGLREL